MTTTDRVIEHLKACDLLRVRDHTVAKALGTSGTRLRMTLAAEGTTYATLRDAERKRRALELLLINPRADSVLIARKTGLVQAKSAQRLFPKWFGVGMREYQRSLRA